MLPSGAGGLTLTSPNFISLSSHLPIPPASRLSPPPPAVHPVVSVEGCVEMQRLCYLKQIMWREGQTVGRFTVQPNSTVDDEHFNKQRRWTNYQGNGRMWHLVGVNRSRSFVLCCTWWRFKGQPYWEKDKVRGSSYQTPLLKEQRHAFHLQESFRLIVKHWSYRLLTTRPSSTALQYQVLVAAYKMAIIWSLTGGGC